MSHYKTKSMCLSFEWQNKYRSHWGLLKLGDKRWSLNFGRFSLKLEFFTFI